MSLAAGPGRGGSSSHLPDEMLVLTIVPHVLYIQSLNTRKDEMEYWLTEHLRLSGLYWGVTALHILRQPEALSREETIKFVLSCQHGNGGFGAAPGHDAHMLYTVSAVQILAMIDAIDELDRRGKGKAKVVKFIADLQNPQSGTFAGDEFGEQDTRFLYGAFNALSLLRRLDAIDIDRAVEYISSCANFDGGYGASPGSESHAGQIFTCLAALSIAGRMSQVNITKLGAWLSERQLDEGGLNGRPEKREDVCYSWWVMSSLCMIGKLHCVDHKKLRAFILRCQDTEKGGFADRPGDAVDVFHTCFALAGLALMANSILEPISPIYCMPKRVVDRVVGSLDPWTPHRSSALLLRRAKN